MKQKIFIIGSIKQEEKIKNIAKLLKDTMNNAEIRHVKKEPLKDELKLINQAYDNIEWADTVIVVTKENGKIGNGTTYEMLYADRLGKKLIKMCGDKLNNHKLNFPKTPEPEIYEEKFGSLKRIN